MSDSFEFTLHSPLTKEDWEKLIDAEHEKTKFVTFQTPQGKQVKYIKCEVLDEIRAEVEQLPTKTRTNWNGCCPDIDYPEIEYIDVTKHKLLSIIDKYKAESEET